MGFKAIVNLLGIENYFGKTEYNNDADFDGTWGIWDEPFFKFFANKLSSFREPFSAPYFPYPLTILLKYRKNILGNLKKGHYLYWNVLDIPIMLFGSFLKKQKKPVGLKILFL